MLVEKLTLTNNVANNQMLNNIKKSNTQNTTTASGAKIVRSPYSNAMTYVKNLLSGGIKQLSSKSIDGSGDATGISYSNTDQVSVHSVGKDIAINFSLPNEANVTVSVLDLSGTEIYSVVNSVFVPGEYDYTASMDKSGIYLVRVTINGNVNIKKVIIK